MRSLIIVIVLSVLFASCKEEFEPSTIAGQRNLLVVEGFINTGGGTSVIKLTRTTDLKDAKKLVPEAGAVLGIEGENGSLLESVSGDNGVCTLSTGSLNPIQKYRLKIKTKNGKEYLSDFLENIISPQFTIGYNAENGGVRVYVSTNDVTNKLRNFSWAFDETWEFHSKFPSPLEVVNGAIVFRDPSININTCWKSNNSKQILIASTENLSETKIDQFPLLFLSSESEKVKVQYKIKVMQYSITKAAYTYLSKMKKSTEDTGTIFDPQPTEIKGNIRCVSDPDEMVVGYLSAGKPSEKTLYLKKEMMPPVSPSTTASGCSEIDAYGYNTALSFASNGYLITGGSVRSDMFKVAPKECVDCRLSGTNIMPNEWPQ
jgi:hypothetical protein